MKYKTTNELGNFRFSDAYIAEIRAMSDSFFMVLDNVMILPENSCNRDIREMRTNELELRIWNAAIASVVEEGYKVYDADGNMKHKEDDRVIPAEAYKEVFEALAGCMIYSIEKSENEGGREYTISIDTEDHTFLMKVTGDEDTQEWNRFLNMED